MFSDKFYNTFRPDFIYTEGDALVPSKALKYKTDPVTKKIIEKSSPRSRDFENSLRDFLQDRLKDENIFPTKKEVFIIITHDLHGNKCYREFDLDNRAKLILDALKGPVYKDDSQVKVLWTYKHYIRKSQESYYSFIVKFLDKSQEEIISSMQQLYR